MLSSSEGKSAAGMRRRNVKELTQIEREKILQRAFGTADEHDNEELLWRIKDRITAVDMALPKVEVRFEHLCVTAQVHTGALARSTLVNFARNIVEGWVTSCLGALSSKKREMRILKDVSGVIKPGRMMLLLGPPGSGKSTLLHALAGKLDKELRSSGSITYNGHALDDFEPQNTAAYVAQEDNHIAELTVRETLDFAARCQGVGYKQEMMKELARRENEKQIRPDPRIDAFMQAIAIKGSKHSLSTDYVLRLLGLKRCADTLVGRGISGGEKKRVTLGEMLVGPKTTFFMDEISTGLDSSTTFQIVKCVRNLVHYTDTTVLMALLQPPPETYELFDDVLLLSEGHVVYMGPREEILEFFKSFGFGLPPRKSVADFLQEVTSRKDQQRYWLVSDKPYVYVSVVEFAQAFRQRSKAGKAIEQELAIPFDKSISHPAALHKGASFGISSCDLLKACMEREILLISRNRFLYVFRTAQVAFTAFITATLFLRTQMHISSGVYANLYLGSLFYALAHMMFHGLSELSMTVQQLPVFYKQRDNRFYPAWAFSIPSWILKIPYSLLGGVIWSCIVYYSIGLTPGPKRFFRYMFLLMLIHQMALGLFRFVGSVGRHPVIANTLGSLAFVVPFLLGGFIINRSSIHSWWIWGYWVSPLSYAQNAIVVNEFLSPRWQRRDLYLSILRPRALFVESYWYWIGAGVLVGYILATNALTTVAFAYLNPVRKTLTSLSEMMGDEVNNEDVVVIEVLQEKGGKKGMVLPFQPLSLTFHNVSYSVDMPTETKGKNGVTKDRLQLLSEVSGAFRPGVLTALMGVSGAGKTTLLDVLAGRKTGGYIEGEIKVSGFPKVQQTFARIAGYVEQTDIHSPQVTVHESLVFSSWLRLASEVDCSTRNDFVAEVMELVELTSLRNALVGIPGTSGLTTEQRKRLTIAVELVANPSIIFMDEPTSGLDARAAAIVMRTVRNTVDTGRTVVCTIHQPSIDIFEKFHELLLLKRGGRVIYSGPIGEQSRMMIDYFQAIEGVPRIPDSGYNPATWMLEITSAAVEAKVGKDFAALFHSSPAFKKTEELISQLSSPPPGAKDLEFETEHSLHALSQLKACLWKQRRSYWQNPYYNVARFFFTTLCALIFGSIFWGVGAKNYSTQQDVFNIMGALFAAVMFLGINNSSTVQPVVAVERPVFWRERAAGMYSAMPYAVAQGAIEIPYVMAQAVVYGVITYSMMQFEWSATRFLPYLGFMFLAFSYFTMFGMMAVAVTPSVQMAAIISSAFFSLWNLFAGFFIPRPSMPDWWRWFYWIDPMSWTVYALGTSQLGNVKDKIQAQGYGDIRVDDFLHQYFGYRYELLGVCAAVLVGFLLLFWIVFATSVKFVNYQKR